MVRRHRRNLLVCVRKRLTSSVSCWGGVVKKGEKLD